MENQKASGTSDQDTESGGSKEREGGQEPGLQTQVSQEWNRIQKDKVNQTDFPSVKL